MSAIKFDQWREGSESKVEQNITLTAYISFCSLIASEWIPRVGLRVQPLPVTVLAELSRAPDL